MSDALNQTISALGEPVSLLNLVREGDAPVVMGRWKHGDARIPVESPDAIRVVLSLSDAQHVSHTQPGHVAWSRSVIGDVALFAPGVSTVTTVAGSADVLQIFVDPDHPGSISEPSGVDGSLPGTAREGLSALAIRLFVTAHCREGIALRRAADALVAAARASRSPAPRIAGQPAKGGLSPSVTRRLDLLISDHLSMGRSAPSLADLARSADLSVGHLVRAFRQTNGATPHRSITARRHGRALMLLATSRLTIAEVADALGFSSPSHFSAAFRQRFGVRPSQYRAAVLRP